MAEEGQQLIQLELNGENVLVAVDKDGTAQTVDEAALAEGDMVLQTLIENVQPQPDTETVQTEAEMVMETDEPADRGAAVIPAEKSVAVEVVEKIAALPSDSGDARADDDGDDKRQRASPPHDLPTTVIPSDNTTSTTEPTPHADLESAWSLRITENSDFDEDSSSDSCVLETAPNENKTDIIPADKTDSNASPTSSEIRITNVTSMASDNLRSSATDGDSTTADRDVLALPGPVSIDNADNVSDSPGRVVGDDEMCPLVIADVLGGDEKRDISNGAKDGRGSSGGVVPVADENATLTRIIDIGSRTTESAVPTSSDLEPFLVIQNVCSLAPEDDKLPVMNTSFQFPVPESQDIASPPPQDSKCQVVSVGAKLTQEDYRRSATVVMPEGSAAGRPKKGDAPSLNVNMLILDNNEYQDDTDEVAGIMKKIVVKQGNQTGSVTLYYCNYCAFNSANRDVFISHAVRHLFVCTKCPYQTFSRIRVLTHGQIHDENMDFAVMGLKPAVPTPPSPPPTCLIKTSLENCPHFVNVMNNISTQNIISQFGLGLRYFCHYCPYRASALSRIVDHVIMHLGSWECRMCGATFSKVCTLISHLETCCDIQSASSATSATFHVLRRVPKRFTSSPDVMSSLKRFTKVPGVKTNPEIISRVKVAVQYVSVLPHQYYDILRDYPYLAVFPQRHVYVHPTNFGDEKSKLEYSCGLCKRRSAMPSLVLMHAFLEHRGQFTSVRDILVTEPKIVLDIDDTTTSTILPVLKEHSQATALKIPMPATKHDSSMSCNCLPAERRVSLRSAKKFVVSTGTVQRVRSSLSSETSTPVTMAGTWVPPRTSFVKIAPKPSPGLDPSMLSTAENASAHVRGEVPGQVSSLVEDMLSTAEKASAQVASAVAAMGLNDDELVKDLGDSEKTVITLDSESNSPSPLDVDDQLAHVEILGPGAGAAPDAASVSREHSPSVPLTPTDTEEDGAALVMVKTEPTEEDISDIPLEEEFRYGQRPLTWTFSADIVEFNFLRYCTTHTGLNLRCQYCDYMTTHSCQMESVLAIKRHLRSHFGPVVFQCVSCEEDATCVLSLLEHNCRQHKVNFNVAPIVKVFIDSRPRAKIPHIRTWKRRADSESKLPDRFKCRKCEMENADLYLLKMHMVSAHPTSNLIVKRCHARVNNKSEAVYLCSSELCLFSADSRSDLDAHQTDCVLDLGERVCAALEKGEVSSGDDLGEESDDDELIELGVTSDAPAAKKRKVVKRDYQRSSEEGFSCFFCDYISKTFGPARTHVVTKHPDRERAVQNNKAAFSGRDQSSAIVYFCSDQFCTFTTIKISEMIDHCKSGRCAVVCEGLLKLLTKGMFAESPEDSTALPEGGSQRYLLPVPMEMSRKALGDGGESSAAVFKPTWPLRCLYCMYRDSSPSCLLKHLRLEHENLVPLAYTARSGELPGEYVLCCRNEGCSFINVDKETYENHVLNCEQVGRSGLDIPYCYTDFWCNANQRLLQKCGYRSLLTDDWFGSLYCPSEEWCFCAYCDRFPVQFPFSSRFMVYALASHTWKEHPDRFCALFNPAQYVAQVRSDQGRERRPQFVCLKCDKRPELFENEEVLREHMAKPHPYSTTEELEELVKKEVGDDALDTYLLGNMPIFPKQLIEGLEQSGAEWWLLLERFSKFNKKLAPA